MNIFELGSFVGIIAGATLGAALGLKHGIILAIVGGVLGAPLGLISGILVALALLAPFQLLAIITDKIENRKKNSKNSQHTKT